MWLDARLPIRFGSMDTRGVGDAVLTDGMRAAAPAAFFQPAAPGTHPLDCTCCVMRTGAATALAQLFRNRALSAGPAFRSVLAVVGQEGEAEIRQAVSADPLVAARYRLG